MAGEWRPVMGSLSWEQLEPAAEATIAAAAAALLWCGEDTHGVLAHVAATTPLKMVSSRIANTIVNTKLPHASVIAVDESLVGPSVSATHR